MFMTSLKSNSSTQAFAKFLTDHFVPCAKRWAYCYRVGCAVNTNMCLERMHGVLKYKYLYGKKNRRLDSAIKAVTSLVSDRLFDRLTALAKGRLQRNYLSFANDIYLDWIQPRSLRHLQHQQVTECHGWLNRNATNSSSTQFAAYAILAHVN